MKSFLHAVHLTPLHFLHVKGQAAHKKPDFGSHMTNDAESPNRTTHSPKRHAGRVNDRPGTSEGTAHEHCVFEVAVQGDVTI